MVGLILYLSDNWTFPKYTFFLSKLTQEWIYYGCSNVEMHYFPYSGRIKLVHFSKLTQEWICYGCSKIFIPLRQPDMPKKVSFDFFFSAL